MTFTYDDYDQIAAGKKCYLFRAATSEWARRIKGCTQIKCIRGFLPASLDFFSFNAFHVRLLCIFSFSILGSTTVNLTRQILSMCQMSRADAEKIGFPLDANNELFPEGCAQVSAIHFESNSEIHAQSEAPGVSGVSEVAQAQICQCGALSRSS